MSIKAKDLSLSSEVYKVSADFIRAVGIKSLDNNGEYINIKLDKHDWHTVQVLGDFTFFEIHNMRFYLNLEDAQKRQEELRMNLIGSLYDDMNSAITKYNDAVQKYFNKPLSTIEES